MPFRLARHHEAGQHRPPVEENRVRSGESFTVVGAAHGGDPDALEERLEVFSRFGGDRARPRR